MDELDVIKDDKLDLRDAIEIMKQMANLSPDTNNQKRIKMLRLLSVDNTQDFQAKLKEWMITYMTHILDKNLEKALNYECPIYYYPMDYFSDTIGVGINEGSYPVTQEDSGADEFSETNNQVAGVDEADFIKNDGSNIYMLVDSRFIIVDAWPPEDAKIISEYAIQGTPKKLFVHNDHAVIYSSLDQINDYQYFEQNECTHGYDCQFTGDGTRLKITILDISNVFQPEKRREFYFDGTYINSRRIDESVYTMILFPEPIVPGVTFFPELDYCGYYYDWWFDPYPDIWEREKQYSDEDIIEIFEDLKEKNRKLIMDSDVSDFQPKVRDISYMDGKFVEKEKYISDLDQIHFSSQQDGSQFLSIFAFNINELSSQQSVSVIGKPGAVYASSSACYLATRHSTYGMPWFFNGWGINEMTTIHKFELKQSPIKVTYKGSGVIKGRVLNQFAMDEHNGYFRVATTCGYLSNPSTHNIISILEQQSAGDLETIGTIENIAPSEDIRSVRFNGDQGFIVTFKKTDPLFVLNLSNPENPTITGELHIPGFSTYMHLMDPDHLLSIGYDSQEQGSFAWFQGVILQVFDISDPSNPSLIYKEIIGTRGTTSEAATNHLAFNYYKPKNLLAIPMAICNGGHGGSYGNTMTFNGLMVYHVTVNNGFDYIGGVDHEIQSSCQNWWTNSDSAVKRSIFMDDYVYSISDKDIRVDSLSEPGKHLAIIDLSE